MFVSRLRDLKRQMEENQGGGDSVDCTDSAATKIIQERQRELEEKTQVSFNEKQRM